MIFTTVYCSLLARGDTMELQNSAATSDRLTLVMTGPIEALSACDNGIFLMNPSMST